MIVASEFKGNRVLKSPLNLFSTEDILDHQVDLLACSKVGIPVDLGQSPCYRPPPHGDSDPWSPQPRESPPLPNPQTTLKCFR